MNMQRTTTLLLLLKLNEDMVSYLELRILLLGIGLCWNSNDYILLPSYFKLKHWRNLSDGSGCRTCFVSAFLWSGQLIRLGMYRACRFPFSVGIVPAVPVLSAGFDLPNASQFASPKGMANYVRFVSGRSFSWFYLGLGWSNCIVEFDADCTHNLVSSGLIRVDGLALFLCDSNSSPFLLHHTLWCCTL